MVQRFLSLAIRQLFGGARRGQPIVTGLAAAATLFGLSRRYRRRRKLIYGRRLKEGETIQLRMLRGTAVVEDTNGSGVPVPSE